MTKAMKRIGTIKRLSMMLPQHSLLTIYVNYLYKPRLDLMINQTIKVYVKKLRLSSITIQPSVPN